MTCWPDRIRWLSRLACATISASLVHYWQYWYLFLQLHGRNWVVHLRFLISRCNEWKSGSTKNSHRICGVTKKLSAEDWFFIWRCFHRRALRTNLKKHFFIFTGRKQQFWIPITLSCQVHDYINKLIYHGDFLVYFFPFALYGSEYFQRILKENWPILIESCYECHSAKSKSLKAGLLRDRKAGWERGGKNGAVIIPGEPNKSILMNALRYNNHDLQMPPSGKLNRTIIADFQKWISEGAHDPRDSTLEEVFAVGGLKAKSLEGRKFWHLNRSNSHHCPLSKRWMGQRWYWRFYLKRIEEKGSEPSEGWSMTLLAIFLILRVCLHLRRIFQVSREFIWEILRTHSGQSIKLSSIWWKMGPALARCCPLCRHNGRRKE